MNYDQLLKDVSLGLETYKDSRIKIHNPDGTIVEKSYAEFKADCKSLEAKLLGSGINDRHLIGLQAYNSYEWMLWEIATFTIGARLVVFPEDYDVKSKAMGLVEKFKLALLVLESPGELVNNKGIVDIRKTADISRFVLCEKAGEHDFNVNLMSKIYSSGTSGYYKGLDVSKQGTYSLMSRFIALYNITNKDRHIIFLPFSNYQQRISLFASIKAGVSLLILPAQLIFRQLPLFRPTFLIGPPVFFENLQTIVRHTPGATIQQFLGGEIRFLITGSSACKHSVLHYFNDNGIPLLEAYGVTETGLIASNRLGANRIGTVGVSYEDNIITLGKDGEVTVKHKYPLSLGYFDASEEDKRQTFLEHGGVATGDIGGLDDDGYLTLKGRKKDIIVTSGGIKFSPVEIERELESCGHMKHVAVVYVEEDSSLVAVTSSIPGQEENIRTFVTNFNRKAPPYKKIQDIYFTEEFKPENNMLTRNYKLNRRHILEKYKNRSVEA